MGQAAFTIAGQVIGAYIGGPIGASIGGAIGSVIGGALFNEDQIIEGQRLTDLKVQNSSYGNVIPLIYGSCRVAGNLIWSTDLREHRIEEDVSPSQKGGPSMTQVRYTYDCDVAIALCEGEIVGIERIFANGILVFDQREGVNAATVFAGGQWATGIYVYNGTEDQLPDPTIEAAIGVGNAQAYRGTAYIVITGMNLNTLKTASIPNFEFVVVQAGTPSSYAQKFVVDDLDPRFRRNSANEDQQPYIRVQQGLVRVWGKTPLGSAAVDPEDQTDLGRALLFDLNGDTVGEGDLSAIEAGWPTYHDAELNQIQVEGGDVSVSGAVIELPVFDSPAGRAALARIASEGVSKVYLHLGTTGTLDTEFSEWQQRVGGFKVVSVAELSITISYPPASVGTLGAVLVSYERWGFAPGVYQYNDTGGISTYGRDLDFGDSLASELVTVGGSPFRCFFGFAYGADNATIMGFMADHDATYLDEWVRFRLFDGVWSVDTSGPISTDVGERIAVGFARAAPSAIDSQFNAGFIEGDNRWVWFAVCNGSGEVIPAHIDDDGILRAKHTFSFTTGDGLTEFADTAWPTVYADNGLCYIYADDALFCYSRAGMVESTGLPLSEIVGNLCDRSDIDAAEYDVTALTQNVRGFAVGVSATARQAIENLRPCFYFDAVDGDKLKFVNRGGASVVDFEYDDIGLDKDPQRLSSEFTQETERPARVNVRYIAQGADYQIGAQSARRETTISRETLEIDVPVVLTDTEAAAAADINMRDQWASAGHRSWKSSLEYSHIEPTDVVTVDDGIVVRTIRVTKRTDTSSLIAWEGVDEDAATYDSNAIAAPVIVPEQVIRVLGPTDIEVLDLPPLTDTRSGNEYSNYIAARGYLDGWTGAQVDVSRDDGATFTTDAMIDRTSIMGVAQTALDDFDGGNVFDELSTVRVSVSGALTSKTHDEVLAGANPCVIGDEILQFRTATLVSAGVYDLSGFLRGRKGTEWAIGTHSRGDRFVMLTTNLGNLPAQTTDRNSETLRVRAVSAGGIPSETESEEFETQIARLMPYSPVHLNATKSAYGSWTLTWNRRDRYMNDWNSGTDVPMSEQSERYVVEVYDADDEVAETYDILNDETVDVSSAVLGAAAPEITFSVWQISAVVGRGFEANATIVGATGIGEWRQSTDTTYLGYVKGPFPSDLPDLPLTMLVPVYLTSQRIRFTGFVVDVQYSYIVGSIAASGAIGVTVAGYNDDGSGSQIDTMNVINRSDWLNVRIARDDADSGYFFVTFTDFNDLNSDIVRFPAVEGTTTQWSSYQLGILGPVTKYSEASGSFNSLVSISTSVFAYHTGLEDIYKLLNTDLSLVATWSKPGSSFVFKDGSDLWLARADEFAKINQTTGAESLNFTVAGTINDAVAVGGYVYVFIPTLEKVKKYALASGAVQAFEYDYIDSFNAFMAGSPVLAIDGTLLSIGRAYVDQATGEYVGTIVVVDTTTDTIL